MKKRHQVLLVLAILSVITFLDRIAISTASNRITQELGLSPQQWGWVLGIFTLSYGGFELPTGLLGDRIGAKKVLIRVVIWWSVFTIFTGLSTGFVMLLVVRFMFGIGEAGAYPNAAIAISRWFPARERGQAQAIIWGASRLGAALTPLIVIPIQQNFGWQMSFFFLGTLGIIWVIFWKYWYKEDPTQDTTISKAELTEILNNRELPEHPNGKSVWRFFKHANLWFLMAMYFCYASGAYFFQGWLPKYLQKGRGFSENELKVMTSLPFLLAAAGCFVGGFLSDWLVKKQGLTWGRRLIGMLSLLLSGAFMLIAALTANNTVAIILLSIGMAIMDFTAPVAWAVAMDISGRNSGAITGSMNMAGMAGAYTTTVSFGYLAANYGYDLPVELLGIILMVGSLLWFRIDASVKLV